MHERRMATRLIITTSCALTASCALQAVVAEATPSNASEAADTLKPWYEGQFRVDETHLLGLPSEPLMSLLSDMNVSASEPPCRGMPSVQVRSAAANDGCPALFTSWGVACTCLEGYASQRKVWEFNVKKKAQTRPINVLTNMTSSDVLEIDVIQTLLVPFDLERLYGCFCSLPRADHRLAFLSLLSADIYEMLCWLVE